ncbi:hypothetical protein PIB30_089364, partial [Stylosanthes scabra]|nr:hypothetical protein [Stylosanthes scabra]
MEHLMIQGSSWRRRPNNGSSEIPYNIDDPAVLEGTALIFCITAVASLPCLPLLHCHHPPPSCISPPTSIITGGMTRNGKTSTKGSAPTAAGSTAGNLSQLLLHSCFQK